MVLPSERFKQYSSPLQLPPALIKDLLRLEERVRLSQETMSLYEFHRKAGSQGNATLQIIDDLQRRVCREMGLPDGVGVAAMRCAETLPQMSAEDVKEVIAISHYRRHNRCRDGSLRVDDAAPRLSLLRLPLREADPLQPSGFPPRGPGPLLVVAASYS